jgi:hypothetical protein
MQSASYVKKFFLKCAVLTVLKVHIINIFS